MAEAFFNYYVNKLNKKNFLSCSSAGTYPKKNVNTNVRKVMKEIGINIIGDPKITILAPGLEHSNVCLIVSF